MSDIPFQSTSLDIWDSKYRLKDANGNAIDETIEDTYKRVAKALAEVEDESVRDYWEERFLWALKNGAIPAGRIMSNAGAGEHKPATSTINCVVSEPIEDSMDSILGRLHEAGITLKHGCVAPGTLVRTEKGLVPVEVAFEEKHSLLWSYDVHKHRFEFQEILRYMEVGIPKNQNIGIFTKNGVGLKTSTKHPVLVYREGVLQYVPAGAVTTDDAMVQGTLQFNTCAERAGEAWWAGAHLGDGSAYYRKADVLRSKAKPNKNIKVGLVFKIRKSDKDVVDTYAKFFSETLGCQAKVVENSTINGSRVWDFTACSSRNSQLLPIIGNQIGAKTKTLTVPAWVKQNPEKYLLPFLAGLVDTDGTISKENGSISICALSLDFLLEIKELLNVFGHSSGLLRRKKPYQHMLNGRIVTDNTSTIKICSEQLVKEIANYMVSTAKLARINTYLTKSKGQHDQFVISDKLKNSLFLKEKSLSHTDKQKLRFYHRAHCQKIATAHILNSWEVAFPDLSDEINFCKTLRPIEKIETNLDIPEVFYDFTVQKNSNYLAGNNGLVVTHNCGIGYEFSTLRPKGAFVVGAGANTSGPLSFMDIYDAACATVASAGNRRGAQLASFDISHPDVEEFISAKQKDGRLRQFNLSILITKDFIEAVKNDGPWNLVFPITEAEQKIKNYPLSDPSKVVWKEWPLTKGYILNNNGCVACKVHKTVMAKDLMRKIMESTYSHAEPGFIMIDEANKMNNNWFCENFRSTNPCGEALLPYSGSCLLGSLNLVKFVTNPFQKNAEFDFHKFREVTSIFTRLLDNVVEVNGLPIASQRREIEQKRRRGMGFTGLGSALAMLRIPYGSPEAVAFTEQVSKELAMEGWRTALQLAKEKGPAPIMTELFDITQAMLDKHPEMAEDDIEVGDGVQGKTLHSFSHYMKKIAAEDPVLADDLRHYGARFTHHSSIAPTGTISLSFGNNVSGGIEPSFAHKYSRNVIKEGKKSKEKVDVYSYELLAYRALVNPNADPYAEDEANRLPDYFVDSSQITPKQHVDMQAAAQKWIDSAISKTINVPTDFPFEDFKDIYMYAYEKGLKGCTTFRFNPEVFQGVLVTDENLKNTKYQFTLEDGSTVEAAGDEQIEYDGETHTAANLFDALKEGYYGRF